MDNSELIRLRQLMQQISLASSDFARSINVSENATTDGSKATKKFSDNIKRASGGLDDLSYEMKSLQSSSSKVYKEFKNLKDELERSTKATKTSANQLSDAFKEIANKDIFKTSSTIKSLSALNKISDKFGAEYGSVIDTLKASRPELQYAFDSIKSLGDILQLSNIEQQVNKFEFDIKQSYGLITSNSKESAEKLISVANTLGLSSKSIDKMSQKLSTTTDDILIYNDQIVAKLKQGASLDVEELQHKKSMNINNATVNGIKTVYTNFNNKFKTDIAKNQTIVSSLTADVKKFQDAMSMMPHLYDEGSEAYNQIAEKNSKILTASLDKSIKDISGILSHFTSMGVSATDGLRDQVKEIKSFYDYNAQREKFYNGLVKTGGDISKSLDPTFKKLIRLGDSVGDASYEFTKLKQISENIDYTAVNKMPADIMDLLSQKIESAGIIPIANALKGLGETSNIADILGAIQQTAVDSYGKETTDLEQFLTGTTRQIHNTQSKFIENQKVLFDLNSKIPGFIEHYLNQALKETKDLYNSRYQQESAFVSAIQANLGSVGIDFTSATNKFVDLQQQILSTPEVSDTNKELVQQFINLSNTMGINNAYIDQLQEAISKFEITGISQAVNPEAIDAIKTISELPRQLTQASNIANALSQLSISHANMIKELQLNFGEINDSNEDLVKTYLNNAELLGLQNEATDKLTDALNDFIKSKGVSGAARVVLADTTLEQLQNTMESITASLEDVADTIEHSSHSTSSIFSRYLTRQLGSLGQLHADLDAIRRTSTGNIEEDRSKIERAYGSARDTAWREVIDNLKHLAVQATKFFGDEFNLLKNNIQLGLTTNRITALQMGLAEAEYGAILGESKEVWISQGQAAMDTWLTDFRKQTVETFGSNTKANAEFAIRMKDISMVTGMSEESLKDWTKQLHKSTYSLSISPQKFDELAESVMNSSDNMEMMSKLDAKDRQNRLNQISETIKWTSLVGISSKRIKEFADLTASANKNLTPEQLMSNISSISTVVAQVNQFATSAQDLITTQEQARLAELSTMSTADLAARSREEVDSDLSLMHKFAKSVNDIDASYTAQIKSVKENMSLSEEERRSRILGLQSERSFITSQIKSTMGGMGEENIVAESVKKFTSELTNISSERNQLMNYLNQHPEAQGLTQQELVDRVMSERQSKAEEDLSTRQKDMLESFAMIPKYVDAFRGSVYSMIPSTLSVIASFYTLSRVAGGLSTILASRSLPTPGPTLPGGGPTPPTPPGGGAGRWLSRFGKFATGAAIASTVYEVMSAAAVSADMKGGTVGGGFEGEPEKASTENANKTHTGDLYKVKPYEEQPKPYTEQPKPEIQPKTESLDNYFTQNNALLKNIDINVGSILSNIKIDDQNIVNVMNAFSNEIKSSTISSSSAIEKAITPTTLSNMTSNAIETNNQNNIIQLVQTAIELLTTKVDSDASKNSVIVDKLTTGDDATIELLGVIKKWYGDSGNSGTTPWTSITPMVVPETR